MAILEQNAEIDPSALRVGSRQVFLMQIGACSGLAAIFLTANALCSPVRKENPASRACGKKSSGSTTSGKIKQTHKIDHSLHHLHQLKETFIV